jgi:PTH2 family peptidyl-tRNA hydrolase
MESFGSPKDFYSISSVSVDMKEFKQMILIRKDLKMSKGKIAAQASHASVAALLKSHKDDLKTWKDQGMKKVVLAVDSKKELLKYKEDAEDAGLVVALVTDAGMTEVEPGTMTCLGIGPHPVEKIDPVTGNLKML